MSATSAHMRWISWRLLRGPVWLYWAATGLWFGLTLDGAPEIRLYNAFLLAQLGGFGAVLDATRCSQQSLFSSGRSPRPFAAAPLTSGARALAESAPLLVAWFAPVALIDLWIALASGVIPPLTGPAYLLATTAVALGVQAHWSRPSWGLGVALALYLLPRSWVGVILLAGFLAALGLVERVRDRQVRPRHRAFHRPGWTAAAWGSAGPVLGIGLVMGLVFAVAWRAEGGTVDSEALSMAGGFGILTMLITAVWRAHRPRQVTQPGHGHTAAGAATAWMRMPIQPSELVARTAVGAACGFGVPVIIALCSWPIAPADQSARQVSFIATELRALFFLWPLVCVSAVHALWWPSRSAAWIRALGWVSILVLGAVLLRRDPLNAFPLWSVVAVWGLCTGWVGLQLRDAPVRALRGVAG